jgi:FKBP-type peptidyl-prolyl cis-trans isomerase
VIRAVLLLFAVAACSRGTEPGSDPAAETYADSLGVHLSSMTKVSRDLYYADVVLGTGTSVVTGTPISLYYTVWLPDGTPVQVNLHPGRYASPLPYSVGSRANIAGWDLGIPGMRVGGTRLLVVGSALAYGVLGTSCGIGDYCRVGHNATLVYRIQIVSSP